MRANLVPRPLLRWDAFALRVDLDMLELLVNRELPRRVGPFRELRLTGEGEELHLLCRLAWQGLPAQVKARLGEARLYRRFFGCRVLGLRGPLGVPIPLELASALVRRFAPELLRLDPSDRILIVDLRRYLPDFLHLEVGGLRCEGRTLEVELAPGALSAPLS